MSGPDTIFALSSGRLPAGVAVIRISGPQVRFVFETMFGNLPEAGRFGLGAIRNRDGVILDRCLAVFFGSPRSFTGEDCCEFHLHGSKAVVQAVLSTLSGFDGCRSAESGEFTQRAFLNGKIDLTEAEGLADLLSAETEAQRRLAFQQADGRLHALYDEWRNLLITARSYVEAVIDFSDEDDVSNSALESASGIVAALQSRMRSHIAGQRAAEIIRDGFNVVIIGAPNSGKSTLLNRLAGRDVAIVSSEAGTTRDLIDVRLDLDGNLVVLTDTAGIREQAGIVETIGIAKALDRAQYADLVLLLKDVTEPVSIELPAVECPTIEVGSKCDLIGADSVGYDCLISATSGHGIDVLLGKISGFVTQATGVTEVSGIQARHREIIDMCLSELDGMDFSVGSLDLLGERLRNASMVLGRLTGRVDVEDLLDVIFSRFCIGK